MKFAGLILAALASSVLAAPTPAVNSSSITNAMQLVSGMKSKVQSDLAPIKSIAGGVTSDVAPMVQTALKAAVADVQGTVSKLVPISISVSVPIAASEVQHVMSMVSDVHSAVLGLKTALESVVSGTSTEVMSLIRPDVSAAMSVAGPLVSPVLSLAYGITSSAAAEGPIPELLAMANGLKTTAGGLLAPVTGVLAGVL